MKRSYLGRYVLIALIAGSLFSCGKEDKKADTATTSSDSTAVGGNCSYTMTGNYPVCLEFPTENKAVGKALCTDSEDMPNPVWVDDKACDVPVGTKGCKQEAHDEYIEMTTYIIGIESCDDGTPVTKA